MKKPLVIFLAFYLILISIFTLSATGCTETAPLKIAPPPPTQQPEVQCPEGCFCLTKEEAAKLGYQFCQGQVIQCSVDKAGNPMYCFEKPAEVVQCPQGCFCLTEEEAAKLGYQFCQGKVIQCGTDQSGNPLYCFSKPVEAQPVAPVQCPPECFCLTLEEAAKSGFPLCQGQLMQCGKDQSGNPMYCFTKTKPAEVTPAPLVECPQGCFCLTKEEADKLGYQLCQGQKMQCSVDKAGNPMYCFQKPGEQVQCPQGCFCLSKEEAARLGYELCGGKLIQCGTDQSGNPMYCFQKPMEQVQCPQGCFCLSKEEAAKLGYELCGGKLIQCGTDQSGNPLYCFQKPAAQK